MPHSDVIHVHFSVVSPATHSVDIINQCRSSTLIIPMATTEQKQASSSKISILLLLISFSGIQSKTVRIQADQISDRLVSGLDGTPSVIVWNEDVLHCDLTLYHHTQQIHPYKFNIFDVSMESKWETPNASFIELSSSKTRHISHNESIRISFKYHSDSIYGHIIDAIVFNIYLTNKAEETLKNHEFEVSVSPISNFKKVNSKMLTTNNIEKWQSITIGMIAITLSTMLFIILFRCRCFDTCKRCRLPKKTQKEHALSNDKSERKRRNSGIVPSDSQNLSVFSSFSKNGNEKINPIELKNIVNDRTESSTLPDRSNRFVSFVQNLHNVIDLIMNIKCK